MKKFLSAILCLVILFSFSACRLGTDKLDLELQIKNQERFSMYKCNADEEYSLAPTKALNGKYYFIDFWENEKSIYCLTKAEFSQSSKEKCFSKGEGYGGSQTLNYGNLFKSFDGGKYDYIYQLQTYKDYLYVLYREDGFREISKIYKINMDNPDDCEPVSKSDNINGYFFYNDEIYVVSLSDVYKMDLNGNNFQTVVNGGTGFKNGENFHIKNIYALNDYLYFVLEDINQESDKKFLYCRCKTNGTQKEVWQESSKGAALAISEKYVVTIEPCSDDKDLNSNILMCQYDSQSLEKIKSEYYNINEEDYNFIEDCITYKTPMMCDGNKVEIMIYDDSAASEDEVKTKKMIIGENGNSKIINGYLLKASIDEAFIISMRFVYDEYNEIIFSYDKYTEE